MSPTQDKGQGRPGGPLDLLEPISLRLPIPSLTPTRLFCNCETILQIRSGPSVTSWKILRIRSFIVPDKTQGLSRTTVGTLTNTPSRDVVPPTNSIRSISSNPSLWVLWTGFTIVTRGVVLPTYTLCSLFFFSYSRDLVPGFKSLGALRQFLLENGHDSRHDPGSHVST